MTLAEIRSQFGALSGRMDLVTADGNGDYGCDIFIREGSKMLDRMADIESSVAVAFRTVSVGDYYLAVDQIRSLRSVWYYCADQSYKLKEGTREQLRSLFSGVLTSEAQGIPAWYITANMRLADLQSDTSLTGFLNKVDFTGEYYNGIIFPPADPAGVMEITGTFYSNPLQVATDENYWSREHPMILIWGALYQLEVTYRNSEGAKDWIAAISQALTTLEFDHVEQQAINLRQMGGRAND